MSDVRNMLRGQLVMKHADKSKISSPLAKYPFMNKNVKKIVLSMIIQSSSEIEHSSFCDILGRLMIFNIVFKTCFSFFLSSAYFNFLKPLLAYFIPLIPIFRVILNSFIATCKSKS